MRSTLFVLLAAFLVGCHLPAYRPPLPERLGPPGRELARGERIRVAIGADRAEGALLHWDSARIVLELAESQLTLAVADVDSAWLHHEGPLTGVLTMTGVVAGLFGGLITAVVYLGDRTDAAATRAAVALVFGGAFAGGYLGNRIGSTGSGWRLVYVRPVTGASSGLLGARPSPDERPRR